ncbi:MAG: GAF domain-containing sensor histidine kinase [Anaerolineales bacterium]|nr:GAF domain-containing sensor histidine kinase [Anaerolineales bacterium]
MTSINTRSVRWLGVLVPIVFWASVLFFEALALNEPISWPAALTEMLLITLGSTVFANWVATSLERQQTELRWRTEHLEALRDAGLALTTELDLGKVLQHVVELSRTLVNARYGALAVLDPDGDALSQFYTAGMTAAQRAAMGSPPAGHGLLGIMTRGGQALRIDDVASDGRAAGFPDSHPQMRTLVGVPIISKGRTFGNLYLADKRIEAEDGQLVSATFTADDQEILEMFASQAAIAIENAQLYRENQQLAVLRERDRIGMDLHDGVIQSIYAIGLLLDDARLRLESEPERVRRVMDSAINGLNAVIQDIRNYIQDLRPQRFEGRNLKQGLEHLAQEIRTDTLLHVALELDGQAATVCTARQADEFLHIAQEALANIRKYADAKHIVMRFVFAEGMLQMAIVDDGIGISPTVVRQATGNGLRNMRERARALHGEFRIESKPGSGTQIIVTAPIEKRSA